MSIEELRVITIVYVSALAPLVILFTHKHKIPSWAPILYFGTLITCAVGWELWFTYGWIDGDPVNMRRSASLNAWLPMNINWLLNSMADAGTISLGGLWLMWKLSKKDHEVFLSWNWQAFGILCFWCIAQNLCVC